MSMEGLDLPQDEVSALREEFAESARVQRYLDEVLKVHRTVAPRSVW